MEEYKDLYRQEGIPSPLPDPSGPQPPLEVPERPPVVPTEPAFYGDPHAPVWQPAPQPPKYDTTPPAEPVPEITKKLYFSAIVGVLLIFLLCLYCIGSDLIHGVIQGDPTEQAVKVVIQTQNKPDLDPEDEHVTAEGTYTVQGVAELVTPSIVEVYAFDGEDFSEEHLNGTGSGIIISEDGYIITNAHVVQGEAFYVILNDGTEHEATVVGADTKTDLAVLKIAAGGLVPATLGDSDEVTVGESVVAIGNPAGLTNTVTQGIVSAMHRQIRSESTAFVMDCIQTDAAISPGNSGGALVNLYGQVIGVTSSKYASDYMTASSYEGLGFAITINQALPIVEELITQGYVSGRFRIGVTFMEADTEYAAYYFENEFGFPMPEEITGLWISEVSEDCDIANTELQPNDFMLTVNGMPAENYDTVMEALKDCKGGDTVTAECARVEEDGTVRYFTIEFKLELDTSGNY